MLVQLGLVVAREVSMYMHACSCTTQAHKNATIPTSLADLPAGFITLPPLVVFTIFST